MRRLDVPGHGYVRADECAARCLAALPQAVDVSVETRHRDSFRLTMRNGSWVRVRVKVRR